MIENEETSTFDAEAHKKSQSFLEQDFEEFIELESLDCRCDACRSLYRTRLRDFLWSKIEGEIELTLNLLNAEFEKETPQCSEYIYRFERKVEKIVFDFQRKLRRATLQKITRKATAHFYERIFSSDLYEKQTRYLRKLLTEELREKDFETTLLDEHQWERYFLQVKKKIWRSYKQLRREFFRFFFALVNFKKKDISSQILQDYLGRFWLFSPAREIKRRVVYHLGPTNSGKTYEAVQDLARAKRGAYLAPLRLLAAELYDTLNKMEVPTTLLTGEEVIETPDAHHYASTIEMAKLQQRVDCAVIDEIQMITDSQRGWAWTRALVGLQADVIHLCGDGSVLELVKQILTLTGDELEIKTYERMTPLKVMSDSLTLGELEPGDALVVFSRREALKYKMDLEALGHKVSIIYGRLGPEVRREQARKFDQGETEILVSTDAIAMGMNLPIKRIIFATLTKFINQKNVDIEISHLKQIAGRAGRFGRYPVGYVGVLRRVAEGIPKIKKGLEAELEQKVKAMLGPDLEIFKKVNDALTRNNLPDIGLSEFLRLFHTMDFSHPFLCINLGEMIELSEMVEGVNDRYPTMSISEIFGFACAPVHLGLMDHVQFFSQITHRYAAEKAIYCEFIDATSQNIDYLETAIKCMELYQWLARHFENKHFVFDYDELSKNKLEAINQLNHLLSDGTLRHCSSCGQSLDADFRYNICESCFARHKKRLRKKRESTSFSTNAVKRKKKKKTKKKVWRTPR